MPSATPMPTLTTGRLRLRPQQPQDAAVFHRLWQERDPRVPARRRPDAQGRPTVAQIAERIGAPDPGVRLWAVQRRETGAVIGYCGLIPREGAPADEPELAFELLHEAQGAGYGTEAALAVVDWARGAGCSRLWASVWDWNLPSRRVLAKLGFVEPTAGGRRTDHGVSLLTELALRAPAR